MEFLVNPDELNKYGIIDYEIAINEQVHYSSMNFKAITPVFYTHAKKEYEKYALLYYKKIILPTEILYNIGSIESLKVRMSIDIIMHLFSNSDKNPHKRFNYTTKLISQYCRLLSEIDSISKNIITEDSSNRLRSISSGLPYSSLTYTDVGDCINRVQLGLQLIFNGINYSLVTKELFYDKFNNLKGFEKPQYLLSVLGYNIYNQYKFLTSMSNVAALLKYTLLPDLKIMKDIDDIKNIEFYWDEDYSQNFLLDAYNILDGSQKLYIEAL